MDKTANFGSPTLLRGSVHRSQDDREDVSARLESERPPDDR
ncbi:hypothetical protein BKA00_006617 [Actinomadura coerulea]|uniref:Uncharacterized protein n=1 Tax=Actinomadura coerulea TaxID=46159 RepID=A0A7X0G5E1_9ACTN|nr:hypothetical protein [Actinomadura coerulea]